MIKLREKKSISYMGTCVAIDSDGDNYGFDPSRFAVAEDESNDQEIHIPVEEFWKIAVGIPETLKQKLLKNPDTWYSYNEDLGVSWAYEPDEDIHYIFRGIP